MNVSSPPFADLAFDNSYARLPERFYARLPPTAMPAPTLVHLNEPLARSLGLDPCALRTRAGVEILAGRRLPDGAAPLAMAYAGHQFGGWVPQLGDGRAVLLGEIVGPDGVRRDLQLKGAGRTPFSRAGDGRAVLGPVLREYLVSEAMSALGVPTTRALAAVLTGESVMRERPFPGALLVRVARSHVRVGTFEYFASRGDVEAVRLLADYVIARHYPEAAHAPQPYRALLDAMVAGQARLIAKWMHLGFIHGVMNTDNMQVAGETIDYGPCAFMDVYDPATVYSSIDTMGRYAYRNQPGIAQWNLASFARTVLPLLDEDEAAAIAAARDALGGFPEHYESAWRDGMRAKLGLAEPAPDDLELARDLLERMVENGADLTLTFRHLSSLPAAGPGPEDAAVRQLFDDPGAFDDWAARWRHRLAREGSRDPDRQAAMQAVNPAYIPRNHLVEEAIQAALDDDLSTFETLLAALVRPFEVRPGFERLMAPPLPHQVVQRTFCGT